MGNGEKHGLRPKKIEEGIHFKHPPVLDRDHTRFGRYGAIRKAYKNGHVSIAEHTHLGIDIYPTNDRNVYAVMDGEIMKVVSEKSGRPGGNRIEIAHADGIRTMYCHIVRDARFDDYLERYKNGERIHAKAGEIIGGIGTKKDDHLHFALLIPKKDRIHYLYVNPRAPTREAEQAYQKNRPKVSN